MEKYAKWTYAKWVFGFLPLNWIDRAEQVKYWIKALCVPCNIIVNNVLWFLLSAHIS